MADDSTLTPKDGPDNKSLTPNPTGPEPTPPGDPSASHQPTIEEIAAERDRYKAAAQGSHKLSEERNQFQTELEQERQRRMELEAQVNWINQQQQTQQYQQMNQPKPDEGPSDDELHIQYQELILSGEKSAAARVWRQMQERTQKRAEDNTLAQVTNVINQGTQMTSLNQFYAQNEILPNTPLYNRTMAIMNQMRMDPRYSFTGGNQAWLATLAAQQAKNEFEVGKIKNTETIKTTAASGAATEGGPNGAPPGESKPNKDAIYLTQSEKATAMAAYRGEPQEIAFKKYWDGLEPWQQEKRRKEGRA